MHEVELDRKTVDIRVGFYSVKRILPGDIVHMTSERKKVEVKIVSIRNYPDFESAITAEDPAKIYPGHSRDMILRLLRSIYPDEDRKYGVYAFGIERVHTRLE